MQLTEQELRIFSRLSKSPEGIDFMEILDKKLLENHRMILGRDKEFRDEAVGYGTCLLELLELFANCDDKLKRISVQEAQDRV